MKIRGSVEGGVHALLNHQLAHSISEALQSIPRPRLIEWRVWVGRVVFDEHYGQTFGSPVLDQILNVVQAVWVRRLPPVILVSEALLGVNNQQDWGLRQLVSV